MLNRFGLVDGERLLDESDEGLRRLERHWRADPHDEGARHRYASALARAGRHVDAARTGSPAHVQAHMGPHVKRFDDAVKANEDATFGRSRKKWKETRDERTAASRALQDHALRIGKHPGTFVRKYTDDEDDTPYHHMHRIGDFHASTNYGTTQHENGATRFRFLGDLRQSRANSDQFVKSIQHHYPHWKPTLEPRGTFADPVVRVHPKEGELNRSHQPADRK